MPSNKEDQVNRYRCGVRCHDEPTEHADDGNPKIRKCNRSKEIISELPTLAA